MESLIGAESEFSNQRYNNTANRAYYACFHPGCRGTATCRDPSFARGMESRVGAEPVRRCSDQQAPSLPHGTARCAQPQRWFTLQSADYDEDPVTQTEANRALRRSRTFVGAIQTEGMLRPDDGRNAHQSSRPACSRHFLNFRHSSRSATRTQPSALPGALGASWDPCFFKPMIDVDNRDEVMDVVIDRLGEAAKRGTVVLVETLIPTHPKARNEAIQRAMEQDEPGTRMALCQVLMKVNFPRHPVQNQNARILCRLIKNTF